MSINCPKCHHENPDDTIYCGKCTTPLKSPKEIGVTRTIVTSKKMLTKGTIIAGRYQIMEKLGEGGMGVVYKAVDARLKRTVALKFLPPELTKEVESKERFVREAQSAAALSHPHICTIHEIDEDGETSFIVMEYVEGQSLKERIKAGPQEMNKALDIVLQVAEGLQEAHGKGIVHRDIKSSNIMITEKGQAKIMDFGLAKVVGESLITKEAKIMGTVAYMSPEQSRGESVDHRTDIWSLGVVLYEMLSGQLPFQGERETSMMYSIVHEEPKDLKKINPEIPEKLVMIIDQALKKKPDLRYKNAVEIRKELLDYQAILLGKGDKGFGLRNILNFIKKPQIAIPAIVLIGVFGFFAVRQFNHRLKVNWAREQAIPEVERLAEEGERSAAFELALEAEKCIPDDAALAKLWSVISQRVSIQSEPEGAKIFWKKYDSKNEDEWHYIGETPMEEVRFPAGFSRIKAERQGFRTVYDATTSDQMSTRLYVLDKVDTIPDEMVHIPSVDISINLPSYPDLESATISNFLMDKFEVTNSDYKKFVDDGGYQKEQYWKHPFIKDGKILSWKEAMSLFVDKTGRNGPSTWEVGDYPEDEANFPVGGVSWYEAAAYAEFLGKSLPTVFHWRRAAGLDVRQRIPRLAARYDMTMGTSYEILHSNFSSQGPAPIGTYQGMTSFGTFDMAGNVREWSWNQSDQSEQRLICGGGWNDPPFMFSRFIYMQPPFDRSPTNGFRCVTYLHPDESLNVLLSQIKPYEYRDFRSEKPASDQEFEIYKRMFAYDETNLNAEIESEDRSNEDWIKQKISYNAAYEDDRITAYMFLPKAVSPPYQVVIYFPGYSVTRMFSSTSLLNMHMIDFIVRDGRAVIYPVYKGTYERRFETGPGTGLVEDREFTIKLFKDLSRTIDYLESRFDLNVASLAYLGFSWGGRLGPLMVALENRIKVCVLVVAGLSKAKRLPEVDGLNYVPRVKTPTLMLNGKYDDTFPYETSQKPMFDLLGISSEHKSHNVYESGHFVPRNQLIRETLKWLDRYLGTVKK